MEEKPPELLDPIRLRNWLPYVAALIAGFCYFGAKFFAILGQLAIAFVVIILAVPVLAWWTKDWWP